MKFLVMGMLSGESARRYEQGYVGDPARFAVMEKYNEALLEAGVLQDGAGLRPTSRASRISFQNGASMVEDGPWPESQEFFGGFTIFECADRAECVEWVRKAPIEDGDTVIIREFMDMDDFPQEIQETIVNE